MAGRLRRVAARPRCVPRLFENRFEGEVAETPTTTHLHSPAPQNERLPASIVIPTIGRPSLATLLRALDDDPGPAPDTVVVVDDRPPGERAPLELPVLRTLRPRVVSSGGRGPAAARNEGWRRTLSPWVVFLDDDVVTGPGWRAALAEDLAHAGSQVLGITGAVRVPLPADRRPTDAERGTAGLAAARWITADIAYRRRALVAVGGFCEAFPRAYREDADLGLRVSALGDIIDGTRAVTHPVRAAPWWASVRAQAGNADDAEMRLRHGRQWRARAGVGRGRRLRHVAITAAGAAALVAVATGRRRGAVAAATGWLAGTAELAWTRIAPGPRTPGEVGAMVATSVAIPPAATAWTIAGWLRAAGRRATARRTGEGAAPHVDAVLFDRDGTLVEDIPYNGDPDKVVLRAGAAAAVGSARSAGLRLGVVSNQSGVGRGLLDMHQVAAVNERVQDLLGRFDVVELCPHTSEDECGCRKPAPGMVIRAASRLGIQPERCAVVGDIGTDVEAALAAGARAVLVPTAVTRREEVDAAPAVARDLPEAVAMILGGSA